MVPVLVVCITVSRCHLARVQALALHVQTWMPSWKVTEQGWVLSITGCTRMRRVYVAIARPLQVQQMDT